MAMYTNDEALAVLAAVEKRGPRMDPSALTGVGTYDEIMRRLEDLEARGWIDIDKPLRGDDRLMSAHGVSLSLLGEQTLQTALLQAVDLHVVDEPDTRDPTPPVATLPDVAAKRRARAEFMSLLYETTDGSTAKLVEPRTIGLSLNWSSRVIDEVVRYLAQEGLIKRPSWGLVAIAHEGVREVEEFLEAPREKTEHFNPIHIYVGDNNSGAIQVGNINSTLTQVTSNGEAVTVFLQELRQALASADVPITTRDLAVAQIDVLEEAIAEEGPDSPIVRRMLPSLRNVALSIVASGVYDGLGEAISHLPM